MKEVVRTRRTWHASSLQGFTFLELILVIAIIAALAGVILITLNPARRLEQVNEAKYIANANDIEKAIGVYTVENGGALPTVFNSLTYGFYEICKQNQSTGCINLDMLIPNHLPLIPEDKTDSSSTVTGFKLKYDPTKNEVGIYSNSEYVEILNSGALLTDNLIGYWKLNEPSWSGINDEVVDSSNYTNHGIRQGNATTALSKFGRGGTFNGSSDGVLISNFDEAVINQTDFAYSLWFKTNNSIDYQQLIGSFSGSWPKSSIAYDGASQRLHYYTASAPGPDRHIYSAVNSAPANQWNHVVVTGNWGDGAIYLYVNGALAGSGLFPLGQLNPTNHTIGYSSQYGRYYFGLIDEVRIYKRALNIDEVDYIYDWGPPPIAYWKFDEGAGDIAVNANSTGNNATLGSTTAAPTWQEESNCKVGKCLFFDGTDTINTASDIGWDETNGISVNFWLKPPTVSTSNRGIMGKKYADWEWAFYQNNAALSLVYWNTSGGHTNGMDNTWGNILQANTWTYISYTWDGAVSRFYSDGVLRGTHTATNPTINQDRANNVMIGGNIYVWGDSYFTGYLDEVKIYDYALTQPQIMKAMQEN